MEIKELLKKVKNGEMELSRAEEILKGLSTGSFDGLGLSALLSEIRSDIDDFEMDAAEQKVQTLIAQLQSRMESDGVASGANERGGES